MGSLPDLGEPRLGRDKILISKVAETGRGSRLQPEPDAGRRQTPGTALKPPWRGHQVERTGIVFYEPLTMYTGDFVIIKPNGGTIYYRHFTGEETEARSSRNLLKVTDSGGDGA